MIYIVSNGKEYSDHCYYFVDAGDFDLPGFIKRVQEWYPEPTQYNQGPSIQAVTPELTGLGNEIGLIGLDEFYKELFDDNEWRRDDVPFPPLRDPQP